MVDLPEQFVNRMKALMGEEELRAFLSSYDSPIRRGLRLNPLKWDETPDEVLTYLVKHYNLRPVPWAQPYGFYYGEERLDNGPDGPSSISDIAAGAASPGFPGETACADFSSKSCRFAAAPEERNGDAAADCAKDVSGLKRNDIPPKDSQEGQDCGQGVDLRPGKSALHEAGLYYIQEPSAMAVAALSQIAVEAPSSAGLSGAGIDADPLSSGPLTQMPCSAGENGEGRSLRGEPRTGGCTGEKILDLCAAPGGKTTMLAAGMRGRGLLAANEIDPARAKILSQNVERMGIANAVVLNESPERLAERFPAFFDRVLVDAPCSGEGMFRREEQALSMWSPQSSQRCAARQAHILDCAAQMVKSGGQLVYSTCTFAPAENEGSTIAFLLRHPEFTLVDLPSAVGEDRMRQWGMEPGRPDWVECPCESAPEAERGGREGSGSALCDGQAGIPQAGRTGDAAGAIRLWPHRLEGEGHYIAVFRKEGVLSGEPVPSGSGLSLPGRGDTRRGGGTADRNALRNRSGRRGNSGSGRYRGTDTRRAVCSAAEESEGIAAAQAFLAGALSVDLAGRLSQESGSGLVRFGDDLWLMPYREKFPIQGLRVLRPGLRIGTVKKNRFEPAHALAMALKDGEAERQISYGIESPETAAYLRGETLPCDPALKGWTLVTAGGISLGWGKASDGTLRNHYPKGLRRPY